MKQTQCKYFFYNFWDDFHGKSFIKNDNNTDFDNQIQLELLELLELKELKELKEPEQPKKQQISEIITETSMIHFLMPFLNN
ncbi:MAG: hypothetical protein WD512_02720, partial [Candidatus Paceibacterota bacterium]